MVPEQTITDFLTKDTAKLAEIISKYPLQIPISVIADWWGCDEDSIRTAIYEHGELGIGWRKIGKLNRGYVIPTGLFVRWYLKFKC